MTMLSNIPSGLGNRIKNIASCFRLDSDVEVFWNRALHPPSEVWGTKLEHFFSNLKSCTHEKIKKANGNEQRTSSRLLVFDHELPDNFSVVEKSIEHILIEPLGRKPINSSCGKTIDFEYERIPENLKKTYIEIFNKFEINEHVLKSVEQFSKKFDGNTISVHIRSCGNEKHPCARVRYEKLFDINRFISIMDEYDDCNFFMSTDADSEKYLKDIKEKIGSNRIITYPKSNETTDCLVEMLLLSKNKVLIGSPLSSFTEMAWWFSGCKSEVKIAWKCQDIISGVEKYDKPRI